MSSSIWAIIGTSNTVNRIVELCAHIGIAAVGYPLVIPRENPEIRAELGRLGELDTCVFTSKRSVELVYQYSSDALKHNLEDSDVYTIGPSTARSVRELFHTKCTYPPTDYSSRGLVALLAGRRLGRTALFSSFKRSEQLVDALKASSQILYQPKLYDLGVDGVIASKLLDWLANNPVRGVVFTCSTATTSISGGRLGGAVHVVAMGPRTRAALTSIGYNPLVPERSTVEGVVRLIAYIEGLNPSTICGGDNV
ncbi:MAG: uroporphyrinogen-III synthase [Thermoprotei archaeon]